MLQRTQYLESAACCSDGRAWRGSSSPKTIERLSPASAPTTGSSPFRTSVASSSVAAGRLRERRLVHLEQAERGVGGGEQRRRDAGEEIGPRRVVGQSRPAADDLRDERGGRRLSVS